MGCAASSSSSAAAASEQEVAPTSPPVPPTVVVAPMVAQVKLSHSPDTEIPSRLDFIRECYEPRANIANPDIGLLNVVVVTKGSFIGLGQLVPFEQCENLHVQVGELKEEDQICFMSHRWQNAAENRPDNRANTQYNLVKKFLLSEEGENITHVWVDYLCVNQDFVMHLVDFKKRLDNLSTAILASGTVLVVPRVAELAAGGGGDGPPAPVQFTDLAEINERGWCLYEAGTALMSHCRLVLTFVAGAPEDARYVEVAGGLGGTPCSLELFQRELHALGGGGGAAPEEAGRQGLGRSYAPAVETALSLFGEALAGQPRGAEEIAQNWRSGSGAGRDPIRLLQQVLQTKIDLSIKGQRMAATQTVDMSGSLGRTIAGLLPSFTMDKDRQTVVNLLVSFLVFQLTGFNKVIPRTSDQVAKILSKSVRKEKAPFGHRENLHLVKVEKGNLLPCDVRELLSQAQPMKNFALWLRFHPLGPQGVSAILAEAPRLQFVSLVLPNCVLGPAGCGALSNFLGTEAARPLRELVIHSNGLGNEEGEMLARGLAVNTTLLKLSIGNNKLGSGLTLHVARALQTNKTLETLGMRDTEMDHEARAALLEAWKPRARKGTDPNGNQYGLFLPGE